MQMPGGHLLADGLTAATLLFLPSHARAKMQIESGHRHQKLGYPKGYPSFCFAGRTRTAGESLGSEGSAASGR